MLVVSPFSMTEGLKGLVHAVYGKVLAEERHQKPDHIKVNCQLRYNQLVMNGTSLFHFLSPSNIDSFFFVIQFDFRAAKVP